MKTAVFRKKKTKFSKIEFRYKRVETIEKSEKNRSSKTNQILNF